MSFFLLGTHPDGRLTLLSDTGFATRQEAMAGLSHLTASPEFDSWDAEVVVVDSDMGTPVLLVRPAKAMEQAPEAAEGDEESELAEEQVPAEQGTEEAVGAQDEQTEEDEVPDAALTAVMLDLGVEEATAEAPETAEETDTEVEDTGAATGTTETAADVEPPDEDAFVAESAAPAEVVDTAWAEAVQTQADEAEGLRGALKRTAAKMEADGITAPESVGPASEEQAGMVATRTDAPEEPVVSEEMPASDDTPAPEVESAAAPVVEEGAPPAAAPDEQADAEQPEATEETSAAEELPAGEESNVADEPPSGTAAWPWDLAADPDSAPPLAALEEPSPDEESMIRALADDDASRTVVLGEYVVEDVKESEPFVEAAKQAAVEEATAAQATLASAERSDDVEPGGITVGGPADGAEPAAAVPDEAPASDFVDLGAVAPREVKAYEPGEVDMSDMTCDDCVYVETCPNSGEREPKDCGSFQWK